MSGAQTEDAQGLAAIQVSECALVGFRRLGRPASGVVLPVFRNEKSYPSAFLYQKQNEGRIVGFVADKELLPDSVQPITAQALIARIGEETIFAYETPDGKIICAQGRNFKEQISRLLTSSDSEKTPFRSLEIARFLKNSALEKKFGNLCFHSLLAKSERLAISWMAGSNLTSAIRSGAYEALQQRAMQRLSPNSTQDYQHGDLNERSQHNVDFSKPLQALREHGFALRKNKDIEGAIFIFRAILERFPTLLQSWMDLGHVLRKADRTDEAKLAYQKLLDRFPDDAEKGIEATGALKKLGHTAEALKYEQALVERFPKDARLQLALGETFQKLGMRKEALESYLNAFDRRDIHVGLLTKAAIAISEFLPPSDSTRIFSEVLDRFPKEMGPRKLLAGHYLRKGDVQSAISAYKDIISLNSADLKARLALAQILANSGDLPGAIDLYRKIIELSPRKEIAWQGLISSLRTSGDIDGARTATNQMTDAIPLPGRRKT